MENEKVGNSSPADYGRWGRVGIVWTSEPTISNINKANIQQLMDRNLLPLCTKFSGSKFEVELGALVSRPFA